jgi:hypothetical protein
VLSFNVSQKNNLGTFPCHSGCGDLRFSDLLKNLKSQKLVDKQRNKYALTSKGEKEAEGLPKVHYIEVKPVAQNRGHNIRKDSYAALAENYADFAAIYKDIDNAAAHAKGKAETFKEVFVETCSIL